MSALLLGWTAAFVGLAGLGALPKWPGGRSRYRLFDRFWCGVFLACAGLQITHFFRPITATASTVVLGIGCVAAVWRLLQDGTVWQWHRGAALWVALFAMFAVWAALASLNEPPQWDFGLYHLPSVRWIQAYPLVSGLANLYPPLGINSSFFLLCAALDNAGFSGAQPHHVAGAVLVLALAAEASLALVNILTAHDWAPSDVFRAFGLPLAGVTVGNWLPTLSPDVAITAIGYATASRLAALLFDPPGLAGDRGAATRLIVAMSVTAVTFKLTMGVYCAGLIVTAVLASRSGKTWARADARLFVLAVVIVTGVWMARAVALSGYPLFPATVAAVDVEWRASPEVVRRYADETFWHTRGGEDLGSVRSLVSWSRNILWTAGKYQVIVPLLLVLGASLVTAITGRRCWTPEALLLVTPAVAAAIVWFLTLPEPRFAGAVFWHLGVAFVVVMASSDPDRGRVSTALRIAVPAAVLVLLSGYLAVGSRSRELRAPWDRPAVPSIPRTTTFVTTSGLVVHTPLADDRCVDAPLPCTPQPDPRLRLRREGGPSGGFTIRSPE